MAKVTPGPLDSSIVSNAEVLEKEMIPCGNRTISNAGDGCPGGGSITVRLPVAVTVPINVPFNPPEKAISVTVLALPGGSIVPKSMLTPKTPLLKLAVNGTTAFEEVGLLNSALPENGALKAAGEIENPVTPTGDPNVAVRPFSVSAKGDDWEGLSNV
jgi:hypothetical protein